MFIRYCHYRWFLGVQCNAQVSQFRLNSGINRKNFYTVLGVTPSAAPKEIKEQFYKLSKEFHPDVNQDNETALARFKEIVEAYETLSNPDQKRVYDERFGFGPRKQSPSIRNRNYRRFNGMKGTFQDGRFVDDEGPPEMRNIQYDLDPAKMERIWKRYKERWDKIEEVERMKELNRKKEEFRRKVDERRANMHNMSPEEKEDFLFKLRMLRTDATESVYKHGSEGERDGHPQHEDTSNEDGGASTWVKRENQKIKQNLDFREKIRESVRERLKENEEILKNTENLQFKQRQKEEEEKMQYDPYYQEKKRMDEKRRQRDFDDILYEGLDNERDPLFKGMNKEAPGNFKDFMKTGYEQSKATVEEMKTAQPFTYHQKSIKHGIVREHEVKVSSKIVWGILIMVSLILSSELLYSDSHDNNLYMKNKKE